MPQKWNLGYATGVVGWSRMSTPLLPDGIADLPRLTLSRRVYKRQEDMNLAASRTNSKLAVRWFAVISYNFSLPILNPGRGGKTPLHICPLTRLRPLSNPLFRLECALPIEFHLNRCTVSASETINLKFDEDSFLLTQAVRLHARRRVDSVAEQAVTRHLIADDARNRRTYTQTSQSIKLFHSFDQSNDSTTPLANIDHQSLCPREMIKTLAIC